jgi:hypothetical protein
MNKIHVYRPSQPLLIQRLTKWLRKSGTPKVDYVIHQMNYRIVRVEFLNPKLELEFIMTYDWVE